MKSITEIEREIDVLAAGHGGKDLDLHYAALLYQIKIQHDTLQVFEAINKNLVALINAKTISEK
jgi:hypothetical protein